MFDKNLEDPEFVKIFRDENQHNDKLDEKLTHVEEIVHDYVEKFGAEHVQRQSDMVETMIKDYLNMLMDQEKKNGGFPDTDAMRVALFGQIAFKYEQRCQKIYQSTSMNIKR